MQVMPYLFVPTGKQGNCIGKSRVLVGPTAFVDGGLIVLSEFGELLLIKASKKKAKLLAART